MPATAAIIAKALMPKNASSSRARTPGLQPSRIVAFLVFLDAVTIYRHLSHSAQD
jgi:hypothetical protein